MIKYKNFEFSDLQFMVTSLGSIDPKPPYISAPEALLPGDIGKKLIAIA